MSWLFATRSAGKQRELRPLFAAAGLRLIFPDELPLPESPDESTIETASSFRGNALAKAQWFARQTGLPTIADDSGLEVDALHGAPGVHSKRFAVSDGGPDEVDAANNAELLRRLEGVPPELRTARYRCVLVAVTPEGQPLHEATGTCDGTILALPVGEGGFGYDPLFFSHDLQLSFGVATGDAKARVSHRGRAVRKLIEALGAGSGER